MVLVTKRFERRPMWAECVRFHRFSARRTVDLKARTVVVNQGLDLVLRLDSFVITGACWSRRDERVVL